MARCQHVKIFKYRQFLLIKKYFNKEHLSETISKINYSKRLTDKAEKNYRLKACEYKNAEETIQLLAKDLRKYIIKSE